MLGYFYITWQFTVMTRESGNSCFQFSHFKFFNNSATIILFLFYKRRIINCLLNCIDFDCIYLCILACIDLI